MVKHKRIYLSVLPKPSAISYWPSGLCSRLKDYKFCPRMQMLVLLSRFKHLEHMFYLLCISHTYTVLIFQSYLLHIFEFF